MNNNYNFAQQGWQCPICKRVYSPFTPCCLTCGAEGRTKTNTDWWIEYQKEPSSFTTSTGSVTYTVEDTRTCDSCKYNAGLPMNTATKEYMACQICYDKNMWKAVD